MMQPLDPDTLAEGERLWAAVASNPDNEVAMASWDFWAWPHFAALLAVARDHARLTAALQEIADDHEPEPLVGTQQRAWCHCGNWAPYNCTAAIARAALSAEAGDTDGD
jgi:hypothetical protein